MKRRSVLRALAAGFALAACGSTTQSGGTKTGGTATATPTPGAKATSATVELAKGGSFTFTLRADKAPQTVERFAGKARSGFYDNLTFHRVEDWVVQGGDPKGTGTGGERVPSEYNDLSFRLGAVG
ncbi:MAG: peptidylprolyl isomerase, partial [Candidatus Limnocylindria bacterium]